MKKSQERGQREAIISSASAASQERTSIDIYRYSNKKPNNLALNRAFLKKKVLAILSYLSNFLSLRIAVSCLEGTAG